MTIKLHHIIYLFQFWREPSSLVIIEDAMGNLLGRNKKRDPQNSRNGNKGRDGRISSTVGSSEAVSSHFPTRVPMPQYPQLQPRPQLPPRAQSLSKRPSFGTHNSGQSSAAAAMNSKQSATAKKYALIPDNFTTLEQVYIFLLID